MRVTNRMITNGMLSNINTNKNRMQTLSEQYATGLKIQKPSEDPIVAVRALKLRGDLSELSQYYEKNIPDALQWMDVTEGALDMVDTILTKMNSYCVQGATDTLTPTDRTNIIQNLEELKEQIYQEGNSDYAGRYVFTGYKTDTSLVFPADTKKYHYTMTEKLTTEDIMVTKKVVGAVDVTEYNEADPSSSVFTAAPDFTSACRIRLAYDELDGDIPQLTIGGTTYTDISVKAVDAEDAYTPEPGKINFIPDTGELVIAEDIFQQYSTLEEPEPIMVTYQKSSFDKNELRPEHYFDCTRTEVDENTGQLLAGTEVDFEKKDQQIEYEINFNQMITVNTQACNSITHEAARMIDDLNKAIDEVAAVEAKIAETDKKLSEYGITSEEKEALTRMRELLATELSLREEALQTHFEKAIQTTQDMQDFVGVAMSDLGSRYARVQLTESRLSTQQVDFEDLLSQNEDADIAETVVNYSSMEVIYNASLSAAAKVVQNTLLDFL